MIRSIPRPAGCLAFALAIFAASAVDAAGPRVIAAVRLGTAGHDNLEGVAIDGDGDVLVVGNAAGPLVGLPAGMPHRIGGAGGEGGYGSAFIARLSAEGDILAAAQLPAGVAKFTTVAVSEAGVYVGGYATAGLEPLVASLGGLGREATTEGEGVRPAVPREHWTDDRFDPGRDVRGTPIVLRFTPDLRRIDAATFLEGWQSVWHVPRPLKEDRWQPTGLAILSDGSVVVSHDGGYVLPTGPGEKPDATHFYRVPDRLSRLSADLRERHWVRTVYTPEVDPAKAAKHLGRPWDFPTVGNTRSLRLRTGADDRVQLAGWSPTRTSSEPWWSPFLFTYDAEGGRVGRLYNPDPMSGGGDRMDGLVSDAAIRSVAVDGEGHLLVAGIGDGGNSVLRQDPRDYRRPAPNLRGAVWGFGGRTLFWGMVARVDAETGELLGGNHINGRVDAKLTAAWPVDLASLPGGGVAVIGRHTRGFDTTEAAWHASDAGSFVRVYDADFGLAFSSSVPDADLVELAARGRRCVAVGAARSADTPTTAPAALDGLGATDGYVLIFEAGEPAAEAG